MRIIARKRRIFQRCERGIGPASSSSIAPPLCCKRAAAGRTGVVTLVQKRYKINQNVVYTLDPPATRDPPKNGCSSKSPPTSGLKFSNICSRLTAALLQPLSCVLPHCFKKANTRTPQHHTPTPPNTPPTHPNLMGLIIHHHHARTRLVSSVLWGSCNIVTEPKCGRYRPSEQFASPRPPASSSLFIAEFQFRTQPPPSPSCVSPPACALALLLPQRRCGHDASQYIASSSAFEIAAFLIFWYKAFLFPPITR